MRSKMYRFWSHDNRIRLMLTLGLAVLLPATALIYVNYHHLKSIERDKKVEALIHRDFHYVLAASEKRLNQKVYAMTEEVRSVFPSPDGDNESDKAGKLDLILSKNPWITHVFFFDREKGLVFRSQPLQMSDTSFREEHEGMAHSFKVWFTSSEGKTLVDGLHRKIRPFTWYTGYVKQAGGDALDDGALRIASSLQRPRRARRCQRQSTISETNLLSGDARRVDFK